MSMYQWSTDPASLFLTCVLSGKVGDDGAMVMAADTATCAFNYVSQNSAGSVTLSAVFSFGAQLATYGIKFNGQYIYIQYIVARYRTNTLSFVVLSRTMFDICMYCKMEIGKSAAVFMLHSKVPFCTFFAGNKGSYRYFGYVKLYKQGKNTLKRAFTHFQVNFSIFSDKKNHLSNIRRNMFDLKKI